MEPEKVTPRQVAPLGSLVSDSHSESDTRLNFPAPTHPQSSAPTPSQVVENTMSDHLTPSTISESPQVTPLPVLSQPNRIAGTPRGSHSSPSPLNDVVPLSSSSEDPPSRAGSDLECPATSTPPYASESCPFPIPLPDSDGEEQGTSLRRVQLARSTLHRDSGIQAREAYTTHLDERTNIPDRSDVPTMIQPTEDDDNQALWVLGDSVLERRDRRVHERWKAGLGTTFVLANVLSVLILCITLELYRRIKAAHPGLILKIRARHIARTGRNTPFSPIVSLFFESGAPFFHSNAVFLAGLCTTLVCTLLSDLALRWVDRYESRIPPSSATPRDRMIARMEWNERIERRAVPWLLEIGIPGFLYISLCSFYTGTLMRAFPYLSATICGAFGILSTIVSVAALWSFEPALDARFRPKPVSSTRR
ncbi:hypothetical protein F5148DRAFT_538595 [Russula earlei]|uniref:Uncharacterized protein n=1 Tax=Russula earlei TaxID=71964 RepID=A0ACC0TY74_9AGAM|nr:hypothetical protein F5148DRAFT_538595 [Russula earlei]